MTTTTPLPSIAITHPFSNLHNHYHRYGGQESCGRHWKVKETLRMKEKNREDKVQKWETRELGKMELGLTVVGEGGPTVMVGEGVMVNIGKQRRQSPTPSLSFSASSSFPGSYMLFHCLPFPSAIALNHCEPLMRIL
ncbi:hypothetical protein LOK49_LG14G00355 [Camellia lanceoleosa]|uniref:Uncharacterized protein n=1 Tax=Camellia lanceoleosa TaxID=1840588 RepID=A0ACC0FAG5_9ERIC|nr:hypothetical protein LOK49_LG14G00355 [Camellia lanceoleosa]